MLRRRIPYRTAGALAFTRDVGLTASRTVIRFCIAMLASRSQSQLLVIDVQENLAPKIDGHARVIANCERLLTYAGRLDVPTTVTEHYSKGLGATHSALLRAAGEAPRLEKITFSCLGDAAINDRLRRLRHQGRTQVVVAGMEAHVCVCQTTLSLLSNGFQVLVVADAVGSRSAEVRQLALERMARAGADVVSHEMVAFEWLERGDDPEFKDVIKAIK